MTNVANGNHIEEILSKNFVADAHLDLAFDIVQQRAYGRKKVLIDDYLEDMKAGGLNLVISSIFIETRFVPEMALRMALGQVEALRSDIEESKEFFSFCTNRAEVLTAYENKKIAIMLSFEGIEPIQDDLNLFKIFHHLGVRGLGLCWSRRNNAAEGSSFIEKRTGQKSGLTNFGINLIERAKSYNHFLDLSHINDEGFEDARQFWQGKYMVSHTNSRVLNRTMRNISDDQIKFISDAKGFIGVNAMNFTVSDGSISEDISGYCNHIDHIIEIGGEDCVGFGFDFNDIILKYIPDGDLDRLPRKPFDCISGYKEIPALVSMLISRGYSDQTIKKIIGQNLLDFLGEEDK